MTSYSKFQVADMWPWYLSRIVCRSTIATLEDKLLGLRQTLMQVEKQLSEENRQIDEKSLDVWQPVFSFWIS